MIGSCNVFLYVGKRTLLILFFNYIDRWINIKLNIEVYIMDIIDLFFFK